MRENRMTFGEHLEELRTRVILSLLALAVSTMVCLSFGDTFMAIVKQPHEHAIKGAMIRRNFIRLKKEGEKLAKVQTIGAAGGRWDLAFPEAVRAAVISRTETELLRPFEAFVSDPRVFEAFPANRRAGFKEAWTQFAHQFTATLRGLEGDGNLPLPGVDYIQRFDTLLVDLKGVGVDREPNWIQELLGFGESFEKVIAPVEQFVRFLKKRREELTLHYLEIPDLAGLKAAVDEAVADEKSQDTVRKLETTFKSLDRIVSDLRNKEPRNPIMTKYQEGFMTYFKVGLIFGLFFALPLILYEMWKFVGAGLYEHEQRYVLVFLPFSIILFVAGSLFGFFVMVPIGLEFLASWGVAYAEPMFALGDYVSLFFTLTIMLGLVFQTPLVMIFLYQIGVVTPQGFAAARKYTLLGAVVFSTLVTPPDPLSWSMMTAPIMILYELGIRICMAIERRKRRPASAEADGSS